MTSWECAQVVPALGVKQAGRPGADRRLVDNGGVDRADPVLDQGVYPAKCNAGLARRGPGLCVGGPQRKKGHTSAKGEEITWGNGGRNPPGRLGERLESQQAQEGFGRTRGAE